MSVQIRSWYSERSKREQRLLLAMAVLAGPVLLWLAVIRPLAGAQERALERHLEAVDRHGRIATLAEAVAAEPSSRPSVQGADLQLMITEAATLAGVSLTDVSPSGGNAVTVALQNARAPAAAEWLRSLETRGVVVEEYAMAATAEGGVNVSARLAAR